jgi:hypothetical protein
MLIKNADVHEGKWFAILKHPLLWHFRFGPANDGYSLLLFATFPRNHKRLLLLAADAVIEKGNAEAATLLESTNERHTGRARNFDIDLER